MLSSCYYMDYLLILILFPFELLTIKFVLKLSLIGIPLFLNRWSTDKKIELIHMQTKEMREKRINYRYIYMWTTRERWKLVSNQT